MLLYIAKRLVLVVPVVFAVALVCFLLVHIAPGDPLVSVLPPDASPGARRADAQGLRLRPAAARAVRHLALEGAATAISAPRSRPAARSTEEVGRAVGNTVMLAVLAALIGFVFGMLFGFLAGYFRDTWIDKLGHHDLDHRRVDAALLARHGAGDHLLGAARLAARGRRRARAAGRGTGRISST